MNFFSKSILLASILTFGLAAPSADFAWSKGGPSSSPSYSRPATPAPSYKAPSYTPPPAPTRWDPPKGPPAPASVPSIPKATPPTEHQYATPPTITTPYSKPGATQQTTPGTAATPPAKPPTVAPNALAASSNKTMSAQSLAAYQAERSQAQHPPTKVEPSEAKNNPAQNQYRGNMDRYMTSRTTIVNNYRTTYPQVYSYSYGLHPNYGMYDSSFLTGMVIGAFGGALIDRATWMYSHQHDPWYRNYRADLDAQAVNNADLRLKLAEMDARIAQLNAQKAAPLAPTALPQGIDSSFAVAPEGMMANDESGHSFVWFLVGGFILAGMAAWAYHLYRK